MIYGQVPLKPSSLEDLKQKAKNSQKLNDKNKEFEAQIRQAKTLQRSGMAEEAEHLFRQVLKKDAGYTRAFQPLKELLKNQQRFGDLIVLVNEYVNARPKDASAKIDKMEIYIWAENDEWKLIAEQVFHANIKREGFLKNLMGRIISAGFVDVALSYINKVRSLNGKPDFYAMELGTYFRMRMAFDKALENYLLHLEHNPQKYQLVSSRLMSFPSDEFIVVRLREILTQSNVVGSKLLLSDLEFRAGNFDQSYALLLENYTKPAEVLQFAQQLSTAKAYSIAIKVYSDIINGEFKKEIKRSAIYGLAQTLEAQSVKTDNLLPISSFFDGNEFFSSSYYDVDESLLPSLLKATSIYDSLLTTDGNLDAAFRLAEIKFRAMNDLDGAFSLYEKVQKKGRSRDVKFTSALRLIDVYFAKGDINNALKNVQEFSKGYRKGNEKLLLNIKKSQAHFYDGDFKASGDSLSAVLKKLQKDSPGFNDLLDVQSILLAFSEDEEAFKIFAEVQLFIRQNKRTQAINKLSELFSIENDFIKDVALYQCAYIELLQDNPQQSIIHLQQLSNVSIFSELGKILLAEIYDIVLLESGTAIDIYLQFLEQYPLSIYYDDIRLRLRELAS